MIVNTPGGDDDYGAGGICFFGSYNEISWNSIDSCYATSYDYGEDGGTIEPFTVSIPMYGNYIHHNFGYNNSIFMEWGGGNGTLVKDNIVAYNVYINDRGWSLMTFHLSDSWAINLQNLRVENNTFVLLRPVSGGETTDRIMTWSGTMTDTTAIFRNNIFYLHGWKEVEWGNGMYKTSHNLYYKTNGSTYFGNKLVLGPGDVVANPMFVTLDTSRIGTYDLHLRSSSPAIDAGLNLGYKYDIDSVVLPTGVSPDIGAFELALSPAGSFYAVPDSLASAGLVTLFWNVTGGQSVSIDHGIGSVPPTGSRTVTVSATTEFILAAGSSVEKVARVRLGRISDVAGGSLPDQFALKQNYPNPFNPVTVIRYELPHRSFVSLKILDLLGRAVRTLVEEEEAVGSHQVTLDATGLASGIYLYQLQSEEFTAVRKCVVLK
jgi:hypothetical protein